MTTINGRTLALLVELEAATTEIIERHFANDEKSKEPSLLYAAPFEVRVHSGDGYLARFLEEGIELYPAESGAEG